MSKLVAIEIDESEALELFDALSQATYGPDDLDIVAEFQEKLREAFGWETDQ